MQLTVSDRGGNKNGKQGTREGKKRFSLRRALTSWAVTTILVVTAVKLLERGLDTLIRRAASRHK